MFSQTMPHVPAERVLLVLTSVGRISWWCRPSKLPESRGSGGLGKLYYGLYHRLIGNLSENLNHILHFLHPLHFDTFGAQPTARKSPPTHTHIAAPSAAIDAKSGNGESTSVEEDRSHALGVDSGKNRVWEDLPCAARPLVGLWRNVGPLPGIKKVRP